MMMLKDLNSRVNLMGAARCRQFFGRKNRRDSMVEPRGLCSEESGT